VELEERTHRNPLRYTQVMLQCKPETIRLRKPHPQLPSAEYNPRA